MTATKVRLAMAAKGQKGNEDGRSVERTMC
jgi:hypothetical protein